MSERQSYKMTRYWEERFRALPTDRTHGRYTWSFWQDLGDELGFDYATVMVTVQAAKNKTFTALPLQHGRHWCWPAALKCPHPASAVKMPVMIERGSRGVIE